MRVLLVSESSSERGGVQTVFKELCRQLRLHGHHVAALGHELQNAAGDDFSGTETFALAIGDQSRLRRSISSAMKIFDPEVVHVVSGRFPLVNAINALVRSTPWFLTVHYVLPWECIVRRFYGRNHLYYIARNLRYTPNVLAYAVMLKQWRFVKAVCFSEHVARGLRRFGCEAERVTVAPLGGSEVMKGLTDSIYDTSPFRENEYPRILTVAGIVHHKGLHDALQAIAGMTIKYPTLRYVIIGGVRDRGYAAYLEQTVRRLQLETHVSFIYNANDALKNAALKEADLYLQPSHEEGFCLAFLEAAMVTGRLVGTSTGEMPAIAANDLLIRIVPRMNSEGLRRIILTLLEDPVSIEVITARRMRLEKKYSWPNFAANINFLYEDILRN